MKEALQTVRKFIAKYKPLIYLLTFILAFIGSWQAYDGEFENPIKEFSSIMRSVLHLYILDPTIPLDEPAPLAYEMAVWLAPLSTLMGLLSSFRQVYYQIRNNWQKNNRQPLLILGWNDDSQNFINNLKEDQAPYHYVLAINVDELEDLDTEALNLDGIEVLPVDYHYFDPNLASIQSHNYRLDQVEELYSFEEEPYNYDYVYYFDRLFAGNQQRVQAYILSTTFRIKQVMDPTMGPLSAIQYHSFNVEDMVMIDLMAHTYFSLYQIPALEAGDAKSVTSLAQVIGSPHVVIITDELLPTALIRVLGNQGLVNPLERIRLTFLGPKAELQVAKLRQHIRHLDQVFDLVAHEANFWDSLDLEDQMEALQDQASSLILDLDDIQQNILILTRFAPYLQDQAVAMRIDDGSTNLIIYEALAEKVPQLTLYGNRRDVLNRQVIISQYHLETSEATRKKVDTIAGQILGTSTQPVKHPSLQADKDYFHYLHRPVRLKVLQAMAASHPQARQVHDLLKSWRTQLMGKDLDTQIAIIQADPYMNYFAQLESWRMDVYQLLRHLPPDPDHAVETIYDLASVIELET